MLRCIVQEVCSAVADESANELYNCNNLCSSDRHSLLHSIEAMIDPMVSIFVNCYLLYWYGNFFLKNSDDFPKVLFIFKSF